MNFKNNKIGVWGFGVVGKSAVNYLKKHEAIIEVLVDATLSETDQSLLHSNHIPLLGSTDLKNFLDNNRYIVPSPGINVYPHASFAHKWLAELDLFNSEYKKPIIAVTGTVGKTSVTYLLDQLLQKYTQRVLTGGNIGIGMLDLLSHPENTDMALLEVSSFQLELCKNFAPDLAIWTTFSENHLDRHETIDKYFDAKYRIIINQSSTQQALLPFALIPYLIKKPKPLSALSFFLNADATVEQLAEAHTLGSLYFVRNDMVVYSDHTECIMPLFDLTTLPHITFAYNWLIIISALHTLQHPLEHLPAHAHTVSIPEHRLERVAIIKNVTFYNDSKSTTPQSTQAALENFNGTPIHLLLGGLSKGIDRAPLIKNLGSHIQHVYCFGKEAAALHALCIAAGKTSSVYDTLEDAFHASTRQAQAGAIVLLSPAGSSYDLFTDYMHRGKRFKELAHAYQDTIKKEKIDACNSQATSF